MKDGDTLKKNRDKPDLKSREKAFAVEETPSFLDYISYLYFVGAPICGPWLEYKDLMDFFRVKGHYKDILTVSTLKPAMIRFS